MNVIGIDLSLVGTAICRIWGDKDNHQYHTEMVRSFKANTIEERIRRLDEVSSSIIEIVSMYTCTDVIIEAPAKNQIFQSAAIGAIHGVLYYRLYKELNVIPVVEQATKIRKAVVGKIGRTMDKVVDKNGKEKRKVNYGDIVGKSGKVKKATVKDIIEMRMRERGLEFPTQDELDAYICARYLWDILVKG